MQATKIDILRQPLITTLLLFTVLAILLWGRFLFFPYPEEILPEPGTPVEGFLLGLSAKSPLISQFAAIMLIFFNGVSVSRTLSRHTVLPSRTYIPMIFCLIICCGFWFGAANIPAILASFILLRSSEHFISSSRRTVCFHHVFTGALLTGCLPIVYPQAAVYLLVIPAAMAVFRRSGRETIIAAIAALIPLLTYAYIMWAFDYGFTDPLAAIWDKISSMSGGIPTGMKTTTDILRLIPAVITVILIILGLVCFSAMSGKMRTRAQAIFTYAAFVLVIGVLSMFLPSAEPAILALFAIPASAVIPALFSQAPGWTSGILYILLLLSVATLNIYPFLMLA